MAEMKILCDTNILIEYYKNNADVLQQLKTIGAANIAVSVITQAELFYGARNKQELQMLERHLSFCYCYQVDTKISELFAQLMKTYSLSHRATIADMLIAATAVVHAVPLYTLNVKDFRFIPNIQLYQ
jgi:predicted nucleic acid-binding protein